MDARIRSLFAGDELSFAHSLEDAQALLDERSFDIAVVCERFASHGFELLRLIAARRRRLPVVGIRVSDPLGRACADPWRETMLRLGAKAVADLRSGSLVEHDRIRRLFYGCIDASTKMLKSNAYTRTLRLASRTLGGDERLAASLGVGVHEVMRWSCGTEIPPFAAYCLALDIVAAGPYAEPGLRDAEAARDRPS